MELTIPKEKKKPEKYNLCTREDLTIKQVVKERAEILGIRNRNWAPHVLELFSKRLAWLDGRIVEEYLKKK